MKNMKTHKVIVAALFAAVVYLATLISFSVGPVGYINLGEGFILLSGMILGSWGALAAGFGAMLADITLGYAVYAPATLIIKVCSSLCISLLYNKIFQKFAFTKKKFVNLTISGLIAELIMVGGYFLFEASPFMYGAATAVLSLPLNGLQALAGIIILITVYSLLPDKFTKMFSE